MSCLCQQDTIQALYAQLCFVVDPFIALFHLDNHSADILGCRGDCSDKQRTVLSLELSLGRFGVNFDPVLTYLGLA